VASFFGDLAAGGPVGFGQSFEFIVAELLLAGDAAVQRHGGVSSLFGIRCRH
jgi:hypothetical protein